MTEQAATAVLACAAVVAPLALGSSGIAPRFTLEATMALAVTLWAVSGKRSTIGLAIPLLLAGLLCLQLLPLPDRLLVSVAPVSAGAWKVAHGGMTATWASASVNPAASLVAIRRLLLGAAVLVAVADLGRYQSHRRRLTAAMTVSGLLILGLGLIFGRAFGEKYLLLGFIPLIGPIYKHVSPIIMPVQTSGAGLPQAVAAAGKQYVMDAGNVGDGFGPYIYSNHFAGAIVLTIPIIIGGWLYLTHRRIPDSARLAASTVCSGIAFVAVGLLAHSRGGAAALVFSLLAMVMLVARKPAVRLTATAALVAVGGGIAAIACLLAYGGDHAWLIGLFPESMQPMVRAAITDTRTIPAQVAVRMFLASPVLGTGLNTYRDIFPRFYRGDFTLFYAHSDYAQLVAETGLIGIALLAAGGWTLGQRLLRFVKDAPEPYRLLAAGPWAALLGFAVHSAFDWNLHLPANAFLAIMVGGLAFSSVPSDRRFKNMATRAEPLLKYSLVASCGLAIALLGRDSLSEHAQRGIRSAIVLDRLATSESQKTDSLTALQRAISSGEKMARWDPSNAQLATLISCAFLHAADRSGQPAGRERMLGSADRWATRAKKLAAAERGLPESLPSS